MVDPNHARLSIVRQCRLVSVARSSFYYEGTGETPYCPTIRSWRLTGFRGLCLDIAALQADWPGRTDDERVRSG